MTADEEMLAVLDIIADKHKLTYNGRLTEVDVREIDIVVMPQVDREQIFEKLQFDGVIKDENKIPVGCNGNLIYRLKILDKFDEVRKEYFIKVNAGKERFEKYFGFNGMTFLIARVNNEPASINFNPKKDEGTDPFYLMSAFEYELKKNGRREDDYIKTTIKEDDVIAYIKNKWPDHDVDRPGWFRYTKNNLKTKIPPAYFEEGLIIIGNFDSILKGYLFAIKASI